jgi:hypothetical protein
MRDMMRLFIKIGLASSIVGVAYVALALMMGPHLTAKNISQVGQAAGLFVTVFLPIGLATWWVFHNLQSSYTRHEAKVVAIVFALFTPVSLLIAVALAQFPGGYSDLLLGPPFGMMGAFVGVIALTAFINFLPTALALWLARVFGQRRPAH